MLLTPPELDETLDGFYWRVRSGGPRSRRRRRRTGVEPAQGHDVLRACAGLIVLLGLMSAVGFDVLVDWSGVAVTGVVAAAGVAWLRRLGAARTGTPRDAPATGPAPRS